MKNLLFTISILTSIIANAQLSKTLINATAGSIGSALTVSEKSKITALTISGNIDARDFALFRDSMPNLIELNLSSATIVAYSGEGGTADSAEYVNRTYVANEIPNNAFYNPNTWSAKTSLRSIVLPSLITSIGISAFKNCSGLQSIVFPQYTSRLGTLSFAGCTGLTALNIPESVNNMGGYVFSGCSKIKSLTVNNPTPVVLADYTQVFGSFNMDSCILFVKKGSKSAYKSASQWNDFKHILEMGTFSVSKDTVELANIYGKRSFFAVQCDALFTIEQDEYWCVLDDSSNTGPSLIPVWAGENKTNADRIATLTITSAGETPLKLIVIQKSASSVANPYLTTSASSVLLGYEEASSSSVNVTSNSTWIASSNKQWLLVYPNTQVTENGSLKLTAQANTTKSNRTAVVTVLLNNGEIHHISVTQTFNNDPELSIPQIEQSEYRINGNTIITDEESKIFDVYGRCMFSKSNVYELHTGMYFICTQNGIYKVFIK